MALTERTYSSMAPISKGCLGQNAHNEKSSELENGSELPGWQTRLICVNIVSKSSNKSNRIMVNCEET